MLLAGQKIGVFGEMHPLVIPQLRIEAADGGSGAALWRAMRILVCPAVKRAAAHPAAELAGHASRRKKMKEVS